MKLEQIIQEVDKVSEGLEAAFEKTDKEYRFGSSLTVEHNPAQGATLVKFFGLVLWNDVDDDREYLRDDECEVVLDNDGEEMREPLSEYIKRQIIDIGTGIVMFLGDEITTKLEEHGWKDDSYQA